MNPNAPHTPDELDRLLSDFFKSQLKRPWPNAPIPAAPTAEPSAVASARTAAPAREPSPRSRDSTARARFTLAASVALLLGTGWFLSDGFRPAVRPGRGAGPGGPGPGFLPDATADGDKHPPLMKIGEDKAKNGAAPKIDLGGLE